MVSREYFQFVLDQLTMGETIGNRRMFGGVGLYAEYDRAGSLGFDPYQEGRASLNYFTVPAEVLEDRESLRRWAETAIEVGREAAKTRPRRRTRRGS